MKLTNRASVKNCNTSKNESSLKKKCVSATVSRYFASNDNVKRNQIMKQVENDIKKNKSLTHTFRVAVKKLKRVNKINQSKFCARRNSFDDDIDDVDATTVLTDQILCVC